MKRLYSLRVPNSNRPSILTTTAPCTMRRSICIDLSGTRVVFSITEKLQSFDEFSAELIAKLSQILCGYPIPYRSHNLTEPCSLATSGHESAPGLGPAALEPSKNHDSTPSHPWIHYLRP